MQNGTLKQTFRLHQSENMQRCRDAENKTKFPKTLKSTTVCNVYYLSTLDARRQNMVSDEHEWSTGEGISISFDIVVVAFALQFNFTSQQRKR